VWLDVNHDGILDSNEPGLANFRVELHNVQGAIVATTDTSSGGGYSFAIQPPADYYVAFIAPNGKVFTLKYAGNDPARMSYANATGLTDNFTLDAGEEMPHLNAGLIGVISGTVWSDTNHNGILDPGEPGIEGVTVELHNTQGTTVTLTVTNQFGLYILPIVPLGEYYIIFILPSGMVFSPEYEGDDETTMSYADANGLTLIFNLTDEGLGFINAGLYWTFTGGPPG
jgi:hypothetical protein